MKKEFIDKLLLQTILDFLRDHDDKRRYTNILSFSFSLFVFISLSKSYLKKRKKNCFRIMSLRFSTGPYLSFFFLPLAHTQNDEKLTSSCIRNALAWQLWQKESFKVRVAFASRSIWEVTMWYRARERDAWPRKMYMWVRSLARSRARYPRHKR